MKTVVREKYVIGIGVIVFSLCFTLSAPGRGLDRLLIDGLFAVRGKLAPPGEIVLVAIDEPSLALLGLQWPWPRSTHARLIDQLFTAGARAVVFDVLFAEPSTTVEDRRLKSTLAQHPDTILAMGIEQRDDDAYQRQSLILPHPELLYPQTPLGFMHLPVDEDGFIRRPALRKDNWRALALQAAAHFSSHLPSLLSIRNAMINYYGPAGSLATVSYYQALEPQQHFTPGFFSGKLVFVGFITTTRPELTDMATDHYPVPYTRWGGEKMAGVEIHATIAANIIANRFVRPLGGGLTITILSILSAVSIVLFFRLPILTGAAVLVTDTALLGSAAVLLFARFQLVLPVQHAMVPLLATFVVSPILRYSRLWRERRFIRKAFSTYVAPAVVKQILKTPEHLLLGGEEREISAFFSDVAGFTSISEKLRPTALVALLNEYLTEMTDIILAHRGTVDKFEGDAIIAFWGAPVTDANHRALACNAAVDMQRRLAEMRADWEARGLPALHMRIGICSGKAVVGNMGSKQRMDYTMMGDTVNIAARLEGVNKVYGTRSLICESTWQGLGAHILSREIDTVRVVGKRRPLRIYEILGRKRDLAPPVIEAVAHYAAGLTAYRNGEWARGVDRFERALEAWPDDSPSKIMADRCGERMKRPAEEPWDGVTTLHHK